VESEPVSGVGIEPRRAHWVIGLCTTLSLSGPSRALRESVAGELNCGRVLIGTRGARDDDLDGLATRENRRGRIRVYMPGYDYVEMCRLAFGYQKCRFLAMNS